MGSNYKPYPKSKASYSPKGALSLDTLFPKLTKQIFENYGFSTARLIADWPAIIGPDLASSTLPEKLKWPHGSPNFIDEQEHSGNFKQQPKGATLVLRVEGPRSIEVQFGAGQIIERINSYFGYRAVTELRIIQAPVPKPAPKPIKLEEIDASDLTQDLPNIKNKALRDALYRMAQGVKAVNNKKN